MGGGERDESVPGPASRMFSSSNKTGFLATSLTVRVLLTLSSTVDCRHRGNSPRSSCRNETEGKPKCPITGQNLQRWRDFSCKGDEESLLEFHTLRHKIMRGPFND